MEVLPSAVEEEEEVEEEEDDVGEEEGGALPRKQDASPRMMDTSEDGSASDSVAFVMTTDIPRGWEAVVEVVVVVEGAGWSNEPNTSPLSSLFSLSSGMLGSKCSLWWW